MMKLRMAQKLVIADTHEMNPETAALNDVDTLLWVKNAGVDVAEVTSWITNGDVSGALGEAYLLVARSFVD